MKRVLALTLSLTLFCQPAAFAQGGVFKQIRYAGGAIPTQVKPDDWGNSLAISPDKITLWIKGGQRIDIDPAKVSSLTYGQEAHRRIGTMIALGILLSPLALFGLLHVTKQPVSVAEEDRRYIPIGVESVVSQEQ